MTGPPSYVASQGALEERLRQLLVMEREILRAGEHLSGGEGSGAAAASTDHAAAQDVLAAILSGIIGGEPRASLAAALAREPAAAEAVEAEAGEQETEAAEAGAGAAAREGPTLRTGSPLAPPHRIPPTQRTAFPQPAPCAFLRPGQAFEGRQRVAHHHHGSNAKQEHWEVAATIQHYDPQTGYIAGTMEAANVPDALAPVRTFFEGEVVDNVNHTFYTADWEACADTDFLHWSKFLPFRELHSEVVKHGGRCPSLASHSHTYMRWKEQFFLTGSECRLTIAGFYYLAVNRVTGEVLGYYFDPSSSPDQKLDLTAVRAGDAGYAFPHYELV